MKKKVIKKIKKIYKRVKNDKKLFILMLSFLAVLLIGIIIFFIFYLIPKSNKNDYIKTEEVFQKFSNSLEDFKNEDLMLELKTMNKIQVDSKVESLIAEIEELLKQKNEFTEIAENTPSQYKSLRVVLKEYSNLADKELKYEKNSLLEIKKLLGIIKEAEVLIEENKEIKVFENINNYEELKNTPIILDKKKNQFKSLAEKINAEEFTNPDISETASALEVLLGDLAKNYEDFFYSASKLVQSAKLNSETLLEEAMKDIKEQKKNHKEIIELAEKEINSFYEREEIIYLDLEKLEEKADEVFLEMNKGRLSR